MNPVNGGQDWVRERVQSDFPEGVDWLRFQIHCYSLELEEPIVGHGAAMALIAPERGIQGWEHTFAPALIDYCLIEMTVHYLDEFQGHYDRVWDLYYGEMQYTMLDTGEQFDGMHALGGKYYIDVTEDHRLHDPQLPPLEE